MNSPGGNRQMAALVSRLLAHYWTADDHEAIRRAQVEDWLTDLQSFTPAVLAEAAGQWRVTESRRPTIAEIYKLCLAAEEAGRPAAQWSLPPPADASFPSRADRDYLRQKIRVGKNDAGTGYTALTLDEKRRWHAYDYAFRRVALHNEGSPLDPEGKWHDRAMIDQAESIYQPHAETQLLRFETMRRQGRAAINAWAQETGHADIDAYAAAHNVSAEEATVAGTLELVRRAAARGHAQAVPGFEGIAAAAMTRDPRTDEEIAAERERQREAYWEEETKLALPRFPGREAGPWDDL